jgi:hypothetical protein
MTAPVDVASGDLEAALKHALATGTREGFTALLTHDVRWGGEQPGEDHECTDRVQAGDHYEGLRAAGVTIHLAGLRPAADDANIFTAQLQVSSPDPDDFPPDMAVRLTLRDGLICDIAVLDSTAIEVLYFDGCPHYQAFLPHLHDLLEAHGITTTVDLIRIDNDADAQNHRFLGSPTVRINGRDIDSDAADHRPISDGEDPSTSPYGMQCRLYRTPGGTTGIPSDKWVLEALSHQTHTDTAGHAGH